MGKCPLGKEIFKVFEEEIMGTFTCTGGVFQAASGALGATVRLIAFLLS